MTLRRVETLLTLLRNNNVEHFKTIEIEIKFGAPPATMTLAQTNGPKTYEAAAENPTSTPAAAAPPVEYEIPHHVNEVAKMMKLSDEELVDKLFPTEAPSPVNE